MSDPLRDLLRASYDRSAPGYDAELAGAQQVKFAALLDAGGDALRQAVESSPALDVGCGTGLWARHLQERGWRPAHLVGLDLSGGMLSQAGGRLPARVQGICQRLPFAAGAFAVLSAVTVLRILDDPLGPCLVELDRVLRPGGWLLLSVLAGRDDRAIPAWLGERGYQVGPRLEAGQDVGWVARKP